MICANWNINIPTSNVAHHVYSILILLFYMEVSKPTINFKNTKKISMLYVGIGVN